MWVTLRRKLRRVNKTKLGYDVTSPPLGRKVESDRMLIVSKLLLSYRQDNVKVVFKARCNQSLIDDTPATSLLVDRVQNFTTVSYSVSMRNFVGCED